MENKGKMSEDGIGGRFRIPPAQQKVAVDAFLAGKIYLREDRLQPPEEAVKCLELAIQLFGVMFGIEPPRHWKLKDAPTNQLPNCPVQTHRPIRKNNVRRLTQGVKDSH